MLPGSRSRAVTRGLTTCATASSSSCWRGSFPGPPRHNLPDAAAAQPAASVLTSVVPREQFAELRFSNRLIITFRAAVVSRPPVDRAESARLTLSRLVEENITGPVASRDLLGASIITVAGRDVFGVVPDDVDVEHDNLASLTAATIGQVQLALAEGAEARTPGRLAWAAGRSLLATALLVIAFVLLTPTVALDDRPAAGESRSRTAPHCASGPIRRCFARPGCSS